ncbi:hypothetical protein [Halocynthiibacter styelae]|uniref:Uncharacterized protein n=1 Tax=Halocynthiibacter styelae TaxID=2761955 RepID=A0A8J7IYT3_9RHOB|nr:hypothetical protein [Paenihalocynthiibacter styelae]MBI1495408.1 hypothetical protein [Paenihalocynthiibacter styelae]
MKRPSFHDLTPEQQAQFGNGVGPCWLPDPLRRMITETASWFFKDASWRHHDFGYAVGGDQWDRARCDWKFFMAMLRDALSHPKWRIIRIPLALMIALMFFLAVRIGGQLGSFEYRADYASLEEILEDYSP